MARVLRPTPEQIKNAPTIRERIQKAVNLLTPIVGYMTAEMMSDAMGGILSQTRFGSLETRTAYKIMMKQKKAEEVAEAARLKLNKLSTSNFANCKFEITKAGHIIITPPS